MLTTLSGHLRYAGAPQEAINICNDSYVGPFSEVMAAREAKEDTDPSFARSGELVLRIDEFNVSLGTVSGSDVVELFLLSITSSQSEPYGDPTLLFLLDPVVSLRLLELG